MEFGPAFSGGKRGVDIMSLLFGVVVCLFCEQASLKAALGWKGSVEIDTYLPGFSLRQWHIAWITLLSASSSC